jgi:hypothetical protein
MFKIRCSQIGSIMTEPKLKADKEAGNLSQTAKTYCENWLKEKLYTRFKDFSTKHTQKGIEVEGDAIRFIAEQMNLGMVFKNEERFENECLQGTPDLIIADAVIDNKSSWDCFTFPLFDEEIPTSDYWWQLQGYMALTGKDKAYLIYTLMDAPDWLIDSEVEKELRFNRVNLDEVTWDVREQMSSKYKYSNLPPHLRIKTFEFKKDVEAINRIYTNVEKCRKYIDSLTTKIKWQNY